MRPSPAKPISVGERRRTVSLCQATTISSAISQRGRWTVSRRARHPDTSHAARKTPGVAKNTSANMTAKARCVSGLTMMPPAT